MIHVDAFDFSGWHWRSDKFLLTLSVHNVKRVGLELMSLTKDILPSVLRIELNDIL